MNERALSVFVDESGDFGPCQSHSPYYLVSMVLHDQDTDISENIAAFRRRVDVLGFFGSARNFKKNYYKHLSAKKIGF